MGTVEPYAYVGQLYNTKASHETLARCDVYVADRTYVSNINFTNTEGWHRIGRSPTDPTIGLGITRLEVMSGTPMVRHYSYITNMAPSISLTVDKPELIAKELGFGTNLISTINDHATADTTVASGASKTGCVLTSGTGFAKGMYVRIAFSENGTYGGFQEIRRLTSVSGTTVTWAPATSQTPAVGTTIAGIKGRTSGTNDSNMGAQRYIGGVAVEDNLMLKIVRTWQGSKGMTVTGFYQVTIGDTTPLNAGDGTAMSTLALAFLPLVQEKSVTTRDGVTETQPVYGIEFDMYPES